jgi:hypothetical protein
MMRRTRPRIVLIAATAALAVGIFASVGGATTAASSPSNTSSPAVNGTARQGETLTTTSGSWSGTTPMSFAYRWQRCDTSGNNCNSISGATSQTYVVSADDVGHTLRSVVTASNTAGSASATSSHTSTVTASPPPTNKSRPQISGTPHVGTPLKTSNGSWGGASPITYAYNWQRCDANGNSCSSISDHSDNQTYTPTSSDLGHTLRVVVTATNGGGSAQATSDHTDVVTVGPPDNSVKPAITGSTQSGQTLTASTGTWSNNPTGYQYAWQLCDAAGDNCAAITGATSSKYTTVATDVGHTIRVVVTATNSVGNQNQTSDAFGPIVSGTTGGGTPGANVIAAASVPDSDRLTVSAKYAPRAIAGRGPITATFKVTDGTHLVSGALVYVLPTPRSWANHPAEVATGATGTATVQLTLTRSAPKTGWLILFVRARTPQGNILGGSSTRRLIQVRITR